jgi:hypothetical protein
VGSILYRTMKSSVVLVVQDELSTGQEMNEALMKVWGYQLLSFVELPLLETSHLFLDYEQDLAQFLEKNLFVPCLYFL